MTRLAIVLAVVTASLLGGIVWRHCVRLPILPASTLAAHHLAELVASDPPASAGRASAASARVVAVPSRGTDAAAPPALFSGAGRDSAGATAVTSLGAPNLAGLEERLDWLRRAARSVPGGDPSRGTAWPVVGEAGERAEETANDGLRTLERSAGLRRRDAGALLDIVYALDARAVARLVAEADGLAAEDVLALLRGLDRAAARDVLKELTLLYPRHASQIVGWLLAGTDRARVAADPLLRRPVAVRSAIRRPGR